jgi:hypothetical protein
MNNAVAVTLACSVLTCAAPVLAEPAHCEAETGPGLVLISDTYDDAGWDKTVLAQQWTQFAVAHKARASSAKCISGSAEDAIDAAYGGAIFTKAGGAPQRK